MGVHIGLGQISQPLLSCWRDCITGAYSTVDFPLCLFDLSIFKQMVEVGNDTARRDMDGALCPGIDELRDVVAEACLFVDAGKRQQFCEGSLHVFMCVHGVPP